MAAIPFHCINRSSYSSSSLSHLSYLSQHLISYRSASSLRHISASFPSFISSITPTNITTPVITHRTPGPVIFGNRYIASLCPSSTIVGKPSSAASNSAIVLCPSSLLSSQQRRGVTTEVESVEQYRQKLANCKDNLIVVQYSASWCGPCRQMKPIVTKWSNDMPTVEFLTVDIDDQSVLAEEEDIKHVPTFVLIKNGTNVEKLIGADAGKMKEAIDKHK
eukprot:GHVS01021723.1.p1 GENE.GHVS01021723.1~~GHVS01021723.1.p1  ORF type:complete len:220 (+),score=45.57 GHVS01021723.1:52-711(+)